MTKLLAALLIGACVLVLGAQALADSAGGTATVHMSDFSFKPNSLTVQTGDTVVFQNDDDAVHNVTADTFQSGDIGSGKSWKYTFTKPGTYAYVCTYHPGMNGTITVKTPSQ